MHYDGIMFGNGMTLNLLLQLKAFIPQNKRYLLDINDFLKSWVEDKLTQREERIFYTAIYGNKADKWKFYEVLKNETATYYENYDADIEYTLGTLLFKKSEYKDIILFFPAFYNIWYIILKDYL